MIIDTEKKAIELTKKFEAIFTEVLVSAIETGVSQCACGPWNNSKDKPPPKDGRDILAEWPGDDGKPIRHVVFWFDLPGRWIQNRLRGGIDTSETPTRWAEIRS